MHSLRPGSKSSEPGADHFPNESETDLEKNYLLEPEPIVEGVRQGRRENTCCYGGGSGVCDGGNGGRGR